MNRFLVGAALLLGTSLIAESFVESLSEVLKRNDDRRMKQAVNTLLAPPDKRPPGIPRANSEREVGELLTLAGYPANSPQYQKFITLYKNAPVLDARAGRRGYQTESSAGGPTITGASPGTTDTKVGASARGAWGRVEQPPKAVMESDVPTSSGGHKPKDTQ